MFLVLFFCLFISSLQTKSLNGIICKFGAEGNYTHSRLTKSVMPQTYLLSLIFDRDLASFNGTLDIDFIVTMPTNKITLHANVDVQSVSLRNFFDPTIASGYEIESTCFIPDKNFMVITLNEELAVNQTGSISISFSGLVSETLTGVYLSSYTTKAGEYRKILSTHFEPHLARNAFPCFDEPNFKAVFIIKLTFPKYYNALSNSPIAKTAMLDENFISVEFKPTMKMSTYLVAWAIHDFESISALTTAGKKVNVWLPSDTITHGKFGIELATKVLTIFEALFNISYPGEKMDLIGIPNFSAGAMENTGLITFRMTSLSVNEKITNIFVKQSVAQTIVHEIAHQWFGNLVTMEYWNDIWLNEGFASFMEYYVTNMVYPDWRLMDQFVYSELLSGMAYDQLSTTHPLSLPSDFTDNLHLLFDPISYNKGAVVLSMLMNALGEETFIQCIRAYLKAYQYGNADSMDLWNLIKNTTGDNVFAEMMLTWTQEKGFPIITIAETSINGTYNISQKRMLMTADPLKKLENDKDEVHWPVPIDFITQSDPSRSHRVWLNSRSEILTLTNKSEWVKINHKFGYFYFTNYDRSLIERLEAQFASNHSVFLPLDRLSIIADLFTCVKLGYIPSSVALNHLKYATKENDFFVMAEIIHQLKHIYALIHDVQDVNTTFRSYVLELLHTMNPVEDWTLSQDRFTRLRKVKIIGALAFFDDPAILATAKDMFERYIVDKTPIELELLPLVACCATKKSNDNEYSRLFKLYLGASDPTEKDIYRVALSCTDNLLNLKWLLNLSLNSSVISKQDSSDIIVDVGMSLHGSYLAWDFVKINWDALVKSFREVPNDLSAIISGTAGNLKTDQDFNDVKDFFNKREEDFLERSINTSLERIGNSVFWIKNNSDDLKSWLQARTQWA